MSHITPEYNQKIIDHFLHPRNIGEIPDADGLAVVGDPGCGDYIKVWIRVQDEKITDFKYKVFGCWGAISTTSVVSELAIGKTLEQASRLTDDDVIKTLGGIPENKQHCSLLGIKGLRAAIADFLVKDNHKKFSARIELYRSHGYDIPKLRDKMVQHIKDLSPDASILDLGVGKGHLSLAIARAGYKCIAVDISPEEIYFARLNAVYYKLDEQIDFKLQDARELSFEDNTFDAVLTAALMHHLIHPELVLNELLRVCKNSGKVIISDLNKKGLEIVARVHEQEGKEHPVLGWSIEQICKWFENKGMQVSVYDEGCETIIVVNLEVKNG